KKNGDKVAIVYRDSEYTYSFIDAQSNRISQWLLETGVISGDRVIIYGKNSEQFIVALFGILKIGAAFVPVHPITPIAKLEFILQDCTPKVIIVDHDLVVEHSPIKDGCRSVLFMLNSEHSHKTPTNINTWGDLEFFDDCKPDINITSDDLAAIIYTSGSTKEPRGVKEPHRKIVFATSAINSVIKNRFEDRIFCGLPFSFDYGLYQIFLSFQVGATLILENDFGNPLSIPRILRLYEVTGFPGVPSVFAMLLHSRLLERVELPKLRYITSTGDVFPVPHIRKLKELFPHTTIYPMYGLTECKRACIMQEGEWRTHESSVGKPLPGTRVSVVDEKGGEVSSGNIGELVITGPHVMDGYWNDHLETNRRFRKDKLTGEIILYSGDFFKKDQDGFLYFMGRDETFIKTRGQKVSPAEIESFFCNFQGIAESAAIGIPDPILGESVCVFVSLIEKNSVEIKELFKQCKHALSPAACPKYIIPLKTFLPKTQNGKIDRIKLRSMAMKAFDDNGK
ncbi:acyl--CoA ligase, partial [candidate division KSB1 bacterium]|nr:acyl--CoA ligase [candidate division KSB1 bacterium]